MSADHFKALVGKVASGTALTSTEALEAFDVIMDGKANESQVAAFLTALHMRGETVEEIAAAAEALRARALTVDAPADAIDTCGTGGDGLGTLNISTAAAIVTAACGVKIAKHGNRAQSSKSGSADVLAALGVKIDLSRPRTPESRLPHGLQPAGTALQSRAREAPTRRRFRR